MASTTTSAALRVVFTQYFDGRDGAGTVGSETRDTDRNYLVQREGTWRTFGFVRRSTAPGQRGMWFARSNRVAVPGLFATREGATRELLALNPLGELPAY